MLNNEVPPVHAGKILRDDIRGRGLTIKEVAAGLGIARVNLSAILNERAGISPELAIKLAVAFGNTPIYWIDLQKKYELWIAQKKVNIGQIKRFDMQKQPTTP